MSGTIINIACGTSFSLLDLLHAVNQALGKNIEPIFEPERMGYVKYSLADISPARELLGYEVKVDFNESIRQAVEWYLKFKS